LIQLQAAQGEPDEDKADQYPEPHLPFLHGKSFYHGEK
jgi:hypothetical protein